MTGKNHRWKPFAPSRRQIIAGGGTVVLAPLAGCSTLAGLFDDMALEEVNAINQIDEDVSGELVIEGPGGETVFDGSFTATEEETQQGFSDVWTDAGSYEVAVELEDGLEIDGKSSAEKMVMIDDTEKELLAIVFGSEAVDDAISFHVVEGLSDLEDVLEHD
ncbi:hypothetical protein RBH26_08110 [Natronolimnohabitans sp. A-GB9]|uniref:hypothetical protein n=1 Tax=Natronolimnohabitans sp. A-GB9 TaxID=3069757 RepID=UPI0027B164A9|nr:hypothetical protein [Natronolimnohabitans sp. A-GB9]MDQ2050450.1 hypothetical protein [Natronolimnohabitans sp. A-GB9]